jgi:hypothetical protein
MVQRPKPSVGRAPGRGGDALRAIVVGSVLAGLGAFAYMIGTTGPSPSLRETAFSRSQKKSEDFATGAVVFVPVLGEECRQKTIDNRTWEIQDQGTAPCKDALAASTGRRSGGSRMDIIRDSFRK